MNKKLFYGLLFLLIAIIVVLINFFLKNSTTEIENYKIVTNNSEFYTVNSCLERFGNYLSTKNSENVYLVTSDTYKKNNNVTKENILEKYVSFDEIFTIISKEMHYYKISDNITKYHVYVNYVNSYYGDTIGEGYIYVYLDKKNGLFSIEPDDGNILKDGASNE